MNSNLKLQHVDNNQAYGLPLTYKLYIMNHTRRAYMRRTAADPAFKQALWLHSDNKTNHSCELVTNHSLLAECQSNILYAEIIVQSESYSGIAFPSSRQEPKIISGTKHPFYFMYRRSHLFSIFMLMSSHFKIVIFVVVLMHFANCFDQRTQARGALAEDEAAHLSRCHLLTRFKALKRPA